MGYRNVRVVRMSGAVCALLLLAFVLSPAALAFAGEQAAASGGEPPRDVLGVRPGMAESEARALLNKIGRQQAEDSKSDVWEVRDERIAHVIVRFSTDNVVRFVIAQARADAKRRMRYDEVADLKRAEHKTDGRNHTYVWRVEPSGDRPGYIVQASGNHPEYLNSYSLFRIAKPKT